MLKTGILTPSAARDLLKRAVRRVLWPYVLVILAGWGVSVLLAWESGPALAVLAHWLGLGQMAVRSFRLPVGVVVGGMVTVLAVRRAIAQAGRPSRYAGLFDSLRSNPFRRLLERRGHPLRVTVITALLLSALTTGLLVVVIWPGRSSWFYPWEFMLNAMLLAGLVVLPPALLAATASLQTALQAGGMRGQLLRLTLLPRRQVAWGYVLAVLHRSRVLLAVVLAFVPVAITLAWYLFAIMNNQWLSLRRVDFTLVYVAVGFGFYGLNLLAVVIGVRVALRIQRVGVAVTVAVLVALLASLAALLVGLGGNYFTYDPNSLWTAWDERNMLPASVGAAIFMLAPYVLSLELLDSVPDR